MYASSLAAVRVFVTLGGLILSGPATAGPKPAEVPLAPLRTHDVAVRDGTGFVVGTQGLELLDLADVQAPRRIGRLVLDATVLGIAVEGQRAYLAAGAHGLYVVDLTDATRPTVLTRFDTPGRTRAVQVRGAYAFLAEHRHGVTVVDLTRPLRPMQVASIATRGTVRALALDGDRLATAEGSAGVRVFDVRRANAPSERSAFPVPGDARDVVFAGQRLVVASGTGGVGVWELDGLGRARPLHERLPLTGSADTLLVWGDRVIVGCGPDGVHLVDPAAGTVLGGTDLPHRYPVGRAAADGNRIWLALDRWGLGVVDLSEPEQPRILAPRERKMQVRFP